MVWFFLQSIQFSNYELIQNEKKKSFIIDNFNLNCLNWNEYSSVRHFYHKLFKLGFIPLFDKPKRVCQNSAKIIDNILTNCVFDDTLKKAIVKSDFYITSQLFLLFR